jgi:hypothetical protein
MLCCRLKFGEPMPIHLDISHLDRIVVAVVMGDVTVDDVTGLAHQFAESGAMHYRKIVDTSAGVLTIDEAGVAAIAAFLRADPKAAARGPLAFVVDPNRPDVFSAKFAELTAGERPVKLFHTLRAARKWLDEHSTIEPRR